MLKEVFISILTISALWQHTPTPVSHSQTSSLILTHKLSSPINSHTGAPCIWAAASYGRKDPPYFSCVFPEVSASIHHNTPVTQAPLLHISVIPEMFSLLTGGNKSIEKLSVRPAFQNVSRCINAEQKIAPALKVQGSLHPWLVSSRLFGKISHVPCSHEKQFNRGREKCEVDCSGFFSPLPCVKGNDDCSFKFWLGVVVIPFYAKCIFLLQPGWNNVILKMSVWKWGKFFGESITRSAYNQLWK